MRVDFRLKHQCYNVDKQFKRLNSKGSKEKRVVFLNKMSNVSILVSDVATAAKMEQEIKFKGKEIEMLHERLENLNVELEEWKKQYKNLEKEKECLFYEMKSEKYTQISSGSKSISELSEQQQNR